MRAVLPYLGPLGMRAAPPYLGPRGMWAAPAFLRPPGVRAFLPFLGRLGAWPVRPCLWGKCLSPPSRGLEWQARSGSAHDRADKLPRTN